MRTIRLMCVLAVLFAMSALLAASASAGSGSETRPIIVPKTAATLPGASYPWVQPLFVRVGAVTLARAPRVIRLSTTTQPPASIPIG